eukprot:g13156.t1
MEQVVNALQALYATSDPQTKKQADDWLTKFQQTPAAWQAAQTMRTKVQFDFYELPADSYMSLRDSMLVHIDRFRAAEHQPIHTMLAIGLADLAIQMDPRYLCRIYVEVGECLVPLVMTQCADAQIVSILQVILRCTDLPSEEISSIPLEFWHRLADEVCRHPETDVKIDQFQGVYLELLSASIRLLTPNTALEHVLKSLLGGQQNGVVVQEAHFFVLTMVASRAEVREGSVLWQLIQSLPPLISATAPEGAERVDGAILHFTKKTAIELPDFLRSSLEMISMLLMASDPPNSPNNMLERTKQVQQAASMAFKEICVGGKLHLQDLVPQLTQLYVSTIALPIRMHLFIVDGVGAVVASLNQEETFRSALEHLVTPLVQGLNTERERPVVLSEILDRLTTIIRQIHIREGSAKAACVGHLISSTFWPVIRQCLAQHPADSKLVEKSCRLIVLEAPTLQPTMQLWSVAIFVQQKEAVEAIIAFIESVLSHIGETFKLGRRYADESKAKIGQLLQPHALQVAPGFVQAIFRLIAGVPTKYVQDSIPSILDHLRSAFSQEFPAWLEAALTQLPPSVGSKAELQKFGEHIIRGDDQRLYEAIQEPVCLRRNETGRTSTEAVDLSETSAEAMLQIEDTIAARTCAAMPDLPEILRRCQLSGPAAVESLVLFSGGAEGVDAIFDAAMAQLTFGQCIHWSFEGHDFRARPEGRVLSERPNARWPSHLWLAARCSLDCLPLRPLQRLRKP